MKKQSTNVFLATLGVMTSLGLMAPAEAGTYSEAILAEEGLVAYYRLAEQTGTVATNAQGTAALNGSYEGVPTQGAVGPRPDLGFVGFEANNRAMANNGSGTKGVKVLKEALGVLTNWTLEAWANSSNVDSAEGQNIFNRDAGGYNDDVLFGLHPENTSQSTRGCWALIHQDDTVARTKVVNPTKALNNQWYHVVATYDDTTGTMALYVNGALVSSHTDLTKHRYQGSASSGDLWIGSSYSGRGFVGTVDEASVYNRALAASEVLEHYQLAVNYKEPDISVIPATLDFGSIETISSAELSVVVTNTGSRLLIISGYTFDYGTNYSVLESAPIYVASGGTTSLTVRYNPGLVASTHNDTLHIASNDPDSPITNIALHGVGRVPITTDYAPAVLAEEGLVAYYRMDESAGTVATNAQGAAALNGSYAGAPTQGAVGPRPDLGFVGFEANNRAMANNGGDNKGVKVLKASLGVLTNWTLEAWANSSDVDGNNGGVSGQNIFNRDAGGYNDDVLLGLHPEGTAYSTLGCWALIHQDDGPQNRTTIQASTKALSNQWYHVVATCDDTTGTMALYVNGVLAGSHTDPSRHRYLGSATSADLWIGSATGATRGFIGTVDEAAVYNRSLDASEVAFHYLCAVLGDTRPKGTLILIQ